jgi:hemoglobin
MPFPIGKAEREQWLWCMDNALQETQKEPALVEYLQKKFREIANSMQNRVDLDL